MKDEREHGVPWSHRGRYQLASRLLCSMPQRQGSTAHYDHLSVQLYLGQTLACITDCVRMGFRSNTLSKLGGGLLIVWPLWLHIKISWRIIIYY